ncbi:MAG: hypothetical protein J3K34DRAFT_482508 [Monoraphidium minutum]|nr:MAG: hypothetical protein J3K34DRAFT_482508 [Monoraphidium minutum]
MQLAWHRQAALQDHISRLVQAKIAIQLPGASRTQPSLVPGAPMSLAQRCGLVPRPDALLTPQQWVAVRARYRACAAPGEDGCAICREAFKGDPQLLLSCSHAFHEPCLRSFERSCRGGGEGGAAAPPQQRRCPLCRAPYQSVRIRDAAEAWRHRCATLIAAAARGWIARRRYRRMLSRAPAPAHPHVQRLWLACRLEAAAAGAVAGTRRGGGGGGGDVGSSGAGGGGGGGGAAARIDPKGGDRLTDDDAGIDALFAELDVSLAAARGVWAAADQRALGQQQGGGESPAAAAAAAAAASTIEEEDAAAEAAVDWASVLARACERGEAERAVCLGALAQGEGRRAVAVLSCSHVLHAACVESFEAFQALPPPPRGGGAGRPARRCPVCRGAYVRRCFAAEPLG